MTLQTFYAEVNKIARREAELFSDGSNRARYLGGKLPVNTPWCAAFARWVLIEAAKNTSFNIDFLNIPKHNPLLVENYKKLGLITKDVIQYRRYEFVNTPYYAIFDWLPNAVGGNHIGLMLGFGVKDDFFTTIEGNTSDHKASSGVIEKERNGGRVAIKNRKFDSNAFVGFVPIVNNFFVPS